MLKILNRLLLVWSMVIGTSTISHAEDAIARFIQRNGAICLESGNECQNVFSVNTGNGGMAFGNQPFVNVPGGQFGATPATYLQSISRMFITATPAEGLPITGYTVQDGSGGFNFPTAVTGYGALNHSGYLVFGGNFLSECFTTGECRGVEIDTNNWSGNFDLQYPENPSQSNLLTAHYASGLYMGCGGTYNCSYAFGVGQNSSYTTKWDSGLYILPSGAARFGVFSDANATQGPQYAAFLRSPGTGAFINVLLQTTGTFTPANQVFAIEDAAQSGHFSIFQDGSIKQATLTVSTLQPCNGGAVGKFTSVSDAASATYNAIVAGSGTNVVLVLCDGTNWRVH
jgi:hypothetical protein